MLTYELIKKLKYAGFPKETFTILEPNSKYPERKGQQNAPTLSELIKACGDKFRNLNYYQDNTKKYWWAAGWTKESYAYEGEGSTPEEAVANLWLELNKKS